MLKGKDYPKPDFFGHFFPKRIIGISLTKLEQKSRPNGRLNLGNHNALPQILTHTSAQGPVLTSRQCL